MYNLQIFEYKNNPIRVLVKAGMPWFVGKDVAEAVGCSKTRDALRQYVDEEDKSNEFVVRDAAGREQNPTFINESGLYSLILRSDKPEAKEFRKWVSSELLHEIQYGEPEPENAGECSGMQVFCNEEFGRVRSTLIDGEPWFVGKDVAEVLGYSNTRDALRQHVDEEDKVDGVVIRDAMGREQTPTFINEYGLYSLILTSKLPSAKRFKRWVISEVLPAIRKTGRYEAPVMEVETVPMRAITVDDTLSAARLLASCRADRLPMVVSLLNQAGFNIDETLVTRRVTRIRMPGSVIDYDDYADYSDVGQFLCDDDDD